MDLLNKDNISSAGVDMTRLEEEWFNNPDADYAKIVRCSTHWTVVNYMEALIQTSIVLPLAKTWCLPYQAKSHIIPQ